MVFWSSVTLGNSKTRALGLLTCHTFWSSVTLGNSKTEAGNIIATAPFWSSVTLGNSKTTTNTTTITGRFGVASLWVTAKPARDARADIHVLE